MYLQISESGDKPPLLLSEDTLVKKYSIYYFLHEYMCYNMTEVDHNMKCVATWNTNVLLQSQERVQFVVLIIISTNIKGNQQNVETYFNADVHERSIY